MSMGRVLESAQAYGRVDESAVGRLAALRGEALPDDVVRKVRGTTHPLVPTHPVTGEPLTNLPQAADSVTGQKR